jgi:hypothetical protein
VVDGALPRVNSALEFDACNSLQRNSLAIALEENGVRSSRRSVFRDSATVNHRPHGRERFAVREAEAALGAPNHSAEAVAVKPGVGEVSFDGAVHLAR